MMETARFFPSPGRSCRFPGKKTVAVGHGEGSGGAVDAGVAGGVEEDSAPKATAARKGAKRNLLLLFL